MTSQWAPRALSTKLWTVGEPPDYKDIDITGLVIPLLVPAGFAGLTYSQKVTTGIRRFCGRKSFEAYLLEEASTLPRHSKRRNAQKRSRAFLFMYLRCKRVRGIFSLLSNLFLKWF